MHENDNESLSMYWFVDSCTLQFQTMAPTSLVLVLWTFPLGSAYNFQSLLSMLRHLIELFMNSQEVMGKMT